MQNFAHLLTTKPHDIRAVFISDLHLSADTPPLNKALVALLNDLGKLPNLHSVYILGDWLDAWIGDDDYLSLNKEQKTKHWLTPILDALKKLNHRHTNLFIMHGNRDFAIGQSLCDVFGGVLVNEPHYQGCYRLEHGDALCTDDKRYQRYRRLIRNPVIKWLLLKQSLNQRRRLASTIKQQSKQDKRHKTAHIMDVNEQAVKHALKQCQILIHGHTHRPAIHHLDNKKRIVLGDWQVVKHQVHAIIGVLVDDDVDLWRLTYETKV